MKDSPKNRLMDGCLEVDKGTKHQVGHGRLWFPDLPLKGLTSDAAPCWIPLSTHPSLQLSFLFAFWVNKFCFPHDPPEGPGFSHLPIQKERQEMKKGEKKKRKRNNWPNLSDWRTQNSEKARKRMKGQQEPGPGRKREQRWVGTDNQKQPTRDEKRASKDWKVASKRKWLKENVKY